MTSASNHGFLRIQIVLRQLGCGNGKNRGAYIAKSRTVAVTEDMIGHKFGEFAPTRIFHGHGGDKKAVKR